MLRIGLLLVLIAAAGCTEYDPFTPDTLGNLAGYEKVLGLPPSPDVTGVYFYADEFGADPLYQLRFIATPQTVVAIADSLGLQDAGGEPNQSVARDDLPWWPAERIEELRCRWKTNADKNRYWLLWHDPESSEVFYLEFGL